MRTSVLITTSFLAGWFMAASTTVWFISADEEAPPVEQPIAHLTEKKGSLDYRSKGELLWRSAGLSQPFGKGTRVATGRASKATITLEDGRVLHIDADSLLVLTKEDTTFSNKQSAFVVTLAKGTVSVKEDSRPSPQRRAQTGTAPKLVLKTKEEEITIKDHSEEVVLAKPKLDAPLIVKAKEGAVEQRPVPVEEPMPKPRSLVASLISSLTTSTQVATLVKAVATLSSSSSSAAVTAEAHIARGSHDATSTAMASSSEHLASVSARSTATAVDTSPPPALSALHAKTPQLSLIATASKTAVSPLAASSTSLAAQRAQPTRRAEPPRRTAVAALALHLERSKQGPAAPPQQAPQPVAVAGREAELRLFGYKAPPQLTLWTLESLQSSLPPLPLSLEPPSSASEPRWRWLPLVSVQHSSGARLITKGKAAWRSQSISLPLGGEFLPAGNELEQGVTLVLQAGASGQHQALDDAASDLAGFTEKRSFRSQSSKVHLRSLADLGEEPVQVSMDLRAKDGGEVSNTWLAEGRVGPASQGEHILQLRLSSGRDLYKLGSLLAKIRAFRISKAAPLPTASEQSLVMVRTAEMIATVTSAGSAAKSEVEDIWRLLLGDLLYQGPPEALLGKDVKLAELPREQQLYVANRLAGSPFFGLENVFVADYGNLQRFLGDHALALFDRPVTVMAMAPVPQSELSARLNLSSLASAAQPLIAARRRH